MIVDKYKINEKLFIVVYPDSECIKVVKDNKIIREINPVVSVGFNNIKFVFCNNNLVMLHSREFRIIYYMKINNFEITYYGNLYIFLNNIWINCLNKVNYPKYVTKEQWNITESEFIKKESIDDRSLEYSIYKNKSYYVNHLYLNIHKKIPTNSSPQFNNSGAARHLYKTFFFLNLKKSYKILDNWNNIQKYIMDENNVNTFLIERFFGCYSCNFKAKGCINCNNPEGTYFNFKNKICSNCNTRWMHSAFISERYSTCCAVCDTYIQPIFSNPLNKENVIKYFKKEYHKYLLMDVIIKERQEYIRDHLYYELQSVVCRFENMDFLWTVNSKKHFKDSKS